MDPSYSDYKRATVVMSLPERLDHIYADCADSERFEKIVDLDKAYRDIDAILNDAANVAPDACIGLRNCMFGGFPLFSDRPEPTVTDRENIIQASIGFEYLNETRFYELSHGNTFYDIDYVWIHFRNLRDLYLRARTADTTVAILFLTDDIYPSSYRKRRITSG